MVRTNEFAEVHPYFDATSVRLADDGEVWAKRPSHHGEPEVYDVFAVDGSVCSVLTWF